MATYEVTNDDIRCTIAIDEDLCTGNGLCMVYGPETFDMNDDMKSVVKPGTRDDLSVIRAAAESCPNFAISITEH